MKPYDANIRGGNSTNQPLTVGSLFSGIGGFEYGLELTGGFRTVWQCECDPYARQVLAKHWPGIPCYEDVRRLCIEEQPEPVDVLCGGFPCQPFSTAGKRKGDEDERHLWPELHRIIRNLRPRWVILENVPGLLSINSGREFGIVLRNLAECGYVVEWDTISAASVGALHPRNRVFIVAHARDGRGWDGFGRSFGGNGEWELEKTIGSTEAIEITRSGTTPFIMADPSGEGDGRLPIQPRGQNKAISYSVGCCQAMAYSDMSGFQEQRNRKPTKQEVSPTKCSGEDVAYASGELLNRAMYSRNGRAGYSDGGNEVTRVFRRCPAYDEFWCIEPDVGRVANGVPNRMDRLRCLGNAVVPQVSRHIGEMILEALHD